MFSLRGNVLLICVSCLILEKMSSAESISNFFPDVNGNLSRVTWTHAVNNMTYLTSTLNNSNIRMIEADVVLGTLAGNSSVIPIMAHPPANSSDLSLELFLRTVTDFNNTPDTSNNGTTNIPVPSNSTNDNGTTNSNSTSDNNAAGTNTTGTNNTVAGGTTPNGSSLPNINGINNDTNETMNNSSSTSGTNTAGTNTADGIITNPNETNLPNIADINNGTNAEMNNSSGTNDANTNSNTTTPDNTNNTNSANSSVPVDTTRLTNTTNNAARKGVKLDFKSIEAFNGSVGIISSYSNASFPLWLNADILPGPGNSTFVPVNAAQFLSQAKQFGEATLSLGWTTLITNGTTGKYTDGQIDEMIDTIKRNNITNEITFAVRSALAAESLPQMRRLLVGIKDSTLTLWSGETDSVNVTKLRSLIADIGLNKIFIDVPDTLMKQLDLEHLPALPSSANLVSKISGIVLSLTFLIVFA